jgi:hypothetical protein
MFPRASAYELISVLKREGRLNLDEVRQQVARDRVLSGSPRGPDVQGEIKSALTARLGSCAGVA